MTKIIGPVQIEDKPGHLRSLRVTDIAADAAILGNDGTVGGPGGSPLSPSVVTGSAPAPSGDESGTVDTAALAAAMPSQGILILRPGDYYVTKLPTVGPGQGIRTFGLGTVVHMVGNGTCLRVFNPAISSAGGMVEFTANMPGNIGPFVIDGEKAGEGSVGVRVGDIYCTRMDGVVVRHFNKTGSTNWLFKSEIAWCERSRITNCHSIDGTQGVVFANGGTGTGSFDYSHFEMSIQAFANQDGLVMEKAGGATLEFTGCKLKFVGNCFAGEANTGTAWRFGADGSKVLFKAAHLDVNFETNGAGAAGHTSINMGANAEGHAYGSLAFLKGATSPAFGDSNATTPNSKFSFAGFIKVDTKLGNHQFGEGLNVLGGSTWSAGATEVAEERLQILGSGGDFFAATLANGVNKLRLKETPAGRAQRRILVLTQPASGAAGTVDWTEPGVNIAGEIQSITWHAGGTTGGLTPSAPALTTVAGGFDVIQLFTLDGVHWFASTLQGISTQLAEKIVETKHIVNNSITGKLLTGVPGKAAKPANGGIALQAEAHPTRTIVATLTGDGAKTEWLIEHKLKARALATVTAQETSAEAPTKVLTPAEVKAESEESVLVKFSVAPGAGAVVTVAISA